MSNSDIDRWIYIIGLTIIGGFFILALIGGIINSFEFEPRESFYERQERIRKQRFDSLTKQFQDNKIKSNIIFNKQVKYNSNSNSYSSSDYSDIENEVEDLENKNRELEDRINELESKLDEYNIEY